MPWCEECDRRIDVDEVADDGTCPECGTVPLEHRKSGYRGFQGVTWVVHHI
jgi:predicted RNA-binding Zn-ribbon protein involved in translation (DUF1610 family)